MNQMAMRREGLCIRKASISDSELLASVIRRAFKDVAAQLGLTKTNFPTHVSFCESGWIESDFCGGKKFFIGATHDGTDCACVGYEMLSPNEIEMRRLAVLPDYQRCGYGEQLIGFVLEECKRIKVTKVTIAIIAEHEKLHQWYLSRGFVDTRMLVLAHLPVRVQYMELLVV